jgi:uroporphyrinogen decarboxylase
VVEEKLSSRERLKLILEHREADRICIDFGGTICTGIHALAQNKLKRHLGFPREDEITVVDTMQQLAEPDNDLMELFHADIFPVFAQIPDKWRLVIHEDPDCYWYVSEWGVKLCKPKPSGYWFDPREHPLANANSVLDIEKFILPDPIDPGRTRGLRERVKAVRENTNYGIALGAPCGGLFETGYQLRGWETWLTDLILNENIVQVIVEMLFNWQSIYWAKVLDEVGDLIDVVQIGEDLGGEKALLMNPSLYRKFFKNAQEKLCNLIKSKTKAKIFLHSCGEIYEMLPDIIDVGIDIINPVQVSCPIMGDTAKLKREFGSELVFWGGGCDTQAVLPLGTPEEVKKEVERRVTDLKQNGGFVFCAVHNIQPDIPPQNILTMYETAFKRGGY